MVTAATQDGRVSAPCECRKQANVVQEDGCSELWTANMAKVVMVVMVEMVEEESYDMGVRSVGLRDNAVVRYTSNCRGSVVSSTPKEESRGGMYWRSAPLRPTDELLYLTLPSLPTVPTVQYSTTLPHIEAGR